MFDCKKCWRCCRELKLEIMELDLIREPKLREYAIQITIWWEEKNNPFDQAYILPNPCPFQIDNKCSIYWTRPNICVAFSDKCIIKTKEWEQ